jgi:hypothetical protein
VKAIDKDGNQSLVSAYDLPAPRTDSAPAQPRPATAAPGGGERQ